ncbi:MAG: hypothetical protein OXH09_20700, partial [Gammaproteobacteria bacterium]|nr:hypothetical protein [Gammaproteobacteria bacterium]
MRERAASNNTRQASIPALALALTVFAFALPNAYGEELIARGADWRYLDDGSDQGTAWRETDFDDSAWESGAARLGFGGDGEVTVLESGHITYYFRHSITVDNPDDIAGLKLAILRDDGAVVYLNGTEVYRTNMPDGTISYDTLASTATEDDTYYQHSFDTSGLVAGTNVIAVEVHQSGATSSDVGFDLSLETTDNELISVGSTWSYLDDGSDQGTAWRETDFDDSGWESGPARLGFGGDGEVTVLESGHITYYFRHSITVDNPADIAGLKLAILRDDGAVVYLNGTEVYRTNMPGGTISYDTFASAGIEDNSFHEHEFDSSGLIAGTNVIAVEVHQSSLTSSDVGFDFSLETLAVAPGANDIVSLGSTWSYLDDGTDQGTAWRESDFDDSGWDSGPAQLGFGEGDEATVITRGPEGGSTTWTTFYFRHDFNVDSTGIAGLEINLRRDDGAIIYLNGTEIVRSNMPAGEVGYQTFAMNASDDGQSLHTYTLSTDALVDGDNVLAVEVHQVNATSSDLSFDMNLVKIVESLNPSVVRGPYLQMGTPSSMIVRWRTDGFTDTKLSYGTAVGNLDTTIEIATLTN